ncbi:MAG: phage integrase N-terminal SAM-like domain-containing protein, partial [Planctomycetia bacterium]
MRERLRTLQYAKRTEDAYMDWIRRYAADHPKQHPRDLSVAEIGGFIAKLAANGASASTQNQALAAILFLYRRYLEVELPPLDAVRVPRVERLPTLLTVDEVRRLLAEVQGGGGAHRLMAELLYGAGLRLLECCKLRVRDVDFKHQRVFIRTVDGEAERSPPLPKRLVEPLREQIERTKLLHTADLKAGAGETDVPAAVASGDPKAPHRLAWQYVFPSARLAIDPADPAAARRRHIHENSLQKSVQGAVKAAGI